MNVGTYRSALFGPQNTKKSLPKFSIGDRAILDKKVHTNPKFSKVQSRTDTGCNVRQKQQLHQEIKKYYKVSNDEVFSRISLVELLQLMLAQPSTEVLTTQDPDKPSECVVKEQYTEEEDTVAQMRGGEMSTDRAVAPPPAYLVVDVRPPSDYQASHIISAINHPLCRLARSINWECSELLCYRNHADRIIIIYDFTEDVAPEYAATLIHRGYENVYMLSGGLKLAKDKFGQPLIVERRKSDEQSSSISNNDNRQSRVETNMASAGGAADDMYLFTLKNKYLPEDVAETLISQLATVFVPPISAGGSKGSCSSSIASAYSSSCPSLCLSSRSVQSLNRRKPNKISQARSVSMVGSKLTRPSEKTKK
ncbi:Rhodanese-like domain [Trinorchestia longiramus]|nr:Rhodanese-like domain [Trinorchestia longiramus]